MNAISSGPKYKFGIIWQSEMEDKVELTVQHASWAIDNCDKDPVNLNASMLNTVQHYKGIHDKCHSSSRCQQDPKNSHPRFLFMTLKQKNCHNQQ